MKKFHLYIVNDGNIHTDEKHETIEGAIEAANSFCGSKNKYPHEGVGVHEFWTYHVEISKI